MNIDNFVFKLLWEWHGQAHSLSFRLEKSSFSVSGAYFTVNCLFPLPTQSLLFLLTKHGRWNRAKLLILNPVTWIEHFLMFPLHTRRPWICLMLVLNLKNRYLSRIHRMLKGFNIILYVELVLIKTYLVNCKSTLSIFCCARKFYVIQENYIILSGGLTS